MNKMRERASKYRSEEGRYFTFFTLHIWCLYPNHHGESLHVHTQV